MPHRYKELFKGAAWYYSRYRTKYPDKFFKEAAKEFSVGGKGRLLDLGCGTGQLAIPLAPYFKEVIAVDPEPQMLREGKRLGKISKIKNIKWVRGFAEKIAPKLGKFTLVTMGRSFHWMDREKILRMIYKILEPGGGAVAIYDRGSMYHETELIWKKVVQDTIKKYLGEERRAGKGFYKRNPKRHEDIIISSPFKKLVVRHYKVSRNWDIQSIIGQLYSTSFSSKNILGKKAPLFEKELRKTLKRIHPSGKFIEKISVEALIMRKPKK